MKFLVLIMALLIAAPTVQAGYCDMESGQGPDFSQSAADERADTENHDCCPDDDSVDQEAGGSCEGLTHCCSCFLGATAIPVELTPVSSARNHAVIRFNTGLVAASHAHPPFRPPIS